MAQAFHVEMIKPSHYDDDGYVIQWWKASIPSNSLASLYAIVQDAASGEVLMLGFMNREALQKTLRAGYVTFFSRTRNQLWTKGETSGNRLEVVSASTDCDRDTILLRVRVLGEGKVCHTGSRSCFTEELPIGAAAQVAMESRR